MISEEQRSDVPPPLAATIEASISPVLRYGVLIAAALILAGVVLFVFTGGARAILLSPQALPANPEADPASVRAVLDALTPPQPAAITDLGLLILMGTPVAGVAVAALAFARRRDWMYVALAVYVLVMLAIGFAVGGA
jgi:uncharacterized membrane protein